MKLTAAVISLFIFFNLQCYADGSLRNNVELPLFTGKISAYLDLIENNSNALFSYNPHKIPADSIINKTAIKTKISTCLKDVFGEAFDFIESGQYIIIKPNKKIIGSGQINSKPNSDKKYVIKGRVVNSITGEVISEAIVYDNDRLISTTTNHEGIYNLTVSAKNEFIPISIKKDNYYDTLILVEPYEEIPDEIDLKPYIKASAISTGQISKLSARDSNRVENVGLVTVIVPKQAFENTNYHEIEIQRSAQISFLPGMGSNRQLGGMVENNISLNILAGYSGAVNGLEIGGLVNVTRQNVNGAQIAGLGNITGGVVSGFQLGGFFNNNRGNINGVQVAGFYNLVLDTVKGIQIAGFTNVLHGKMDGIQISGFSNVTTQDVDGVQLTGFSNVAIGNVDMIQVAGFSNYGKNVGGGQISGFGNMALGSVGGGQLSGFMNIAGSDIGGWQAAGFMNVAGGQVKGGQLAGFINVAKTVKGLQLAPFNFADSSSGISIGFFSFVRTGYHALGYTYNETFPMAFSFKTGVDKFYNIFSYSINTNENIVGLGYGLGTLKRFKNKLFRSWEYEAIQMRSTNVSQFEFNMLSQLRLNIGYEITPWLNLHAGPHYAMHIRDVLPDNYPPLQNPFNTENYILGNTEWSQWLGGQVGLQIEF